MSVAGVAFKAFGGYFKGKRLETLSENTAVYNDI